jgi:hypothetical protein
MRIFLCGWILIGWMAVGCARRPTPSGVAPSTGSPTPVPIPTGRSLSTPTVPIPTATALLTPTPTPDPYADLTVEALRRRVYGGGSIRIERTLTVTPAFTRTLIAYPSDGLTVYGFMNVPPGEGPVPGGDRAARLCGSGALFDAGLHDPLRRRPRPGRLSGAPSQLPEPPTLR